VDGIFTHAVYVPELVAHKLDEVEHLERTVDLQADDALAVAGHAG
jgi:hypothetical protein